MRGFRTLALGLMTWVLIVSSTHAAGMPPRFAWRLFQLRAARYSALMARSPRFAALNLPVSPGPVSSPAPQVTAPAPVVVPDNPAPPTPVMAVVQTVSVPVVPVVANPAPSAPVVPAVNTAPAPVNVPVPVAPLAVSTPPVPAPAAVSHPAAWTVQAQQSASVPQVDAFLNLGQGPYPQAQNLTTGGAQPWYDSSAVAALFGGTPTAAQQADFSSTVLQRVEKTFQLAGVPVTLTTDPNTPAAHTLSLVSNTTSSWGPVLGLTTLGDSGFSFVDQDAKNAQNVDQLEWIVAHNIAHELMLAFGVPETHDQSGKTIDSTVGNLSMFLDPNATFSPSAAQDLLSRNFRTNVVTGPYGSQAQDLNAAAVPEPSTYLVWILAAGAGLMRKKLRAA